MKKKASFWKYTGNHSSGKDCERRDPHGFGIEVISYLAHVGDGGDYQKPLTYEDTKQIQTKHKRNDGFGEEIEVVAPAEVWQRGKESYAAMLEAMY